MKKKIITRLKKLAAGFTAVTLLGSLAGGQVFAAEDGEGAATVVDVAAFGADPTGKADSAAAVQRAMEHAKTMDGPVTLSFPKGEYHFWADYAPERELYVSNTIGDNQYYRNKKIGILVEDMNDVTIDGGGSLFIYHGDITTLAAIRSHNVTFTNFSFDFASPTVVDVTVEERGSNYAVAYVPECYQYTISGTDIIWTGEESPITGRPYWSGKNGLEYAQIYDYSSGSTWRDDSYLFRNVSRIEELGNNRLKITYSSGTGPEPGYCFQMRNTARTTPGALFWESSDVKVQDINAYYLHGFGMVGQLSDTITLERVNFAARPGTGRTTAGFADFIQMSSVKGKITVKDCVFSNPHDDPINIHGTYLSVERVDSETNTYTVRYKHHQTSGFPQFYVGDEVEFVKKSTLLAVPNSTARVVAVDGPNPGSLDTIRITLDQVVPEVTGGDVYDVENITYTPEVEIRGNKFMEVPTRGVLVTTRKKVVIEDNYFDAMSMPSIFISCDAHQWYESGPVRDVTIRGNTFDRPGDRAILIQPTNVESDPRGKVHENIVIENNTFNLLDKPLLEAKGVDRLVVRNNRVNRYSPDVSLDLSAASTHLSVGEAQTLSLTQQGGVQGSVLYQFTDSCSNAVIEGNHYDGGLNIRADGIRLEDVSIVDDEVKLGENNNKPPLGNIRFFSSNEAVAAVLPGGTILARSEGSADITAFTQINGRLYTSNPVSVTVTGSPEERSADSIAVTAETDYMDINTRTLQCGASVLPEELNQTVAWWVRDPVTKKATALAEISQDGLLSAHSGGVVEVGATSVVDSSVSGTMLITIEPREGIRNPVWKIENENTSKWKLNNGGVTIQAENGGMWGGGGSVKNIFWTDLPAGDRDTVVTVKMTGRPANGYEEAGLIFMTNQDNYCAAVRKNGNGNNVIAVNNEEGGNASEHTLSDQRGDTVYFKIVRDGARFTAYESADNSTWTQIAAVNNNALGGDIKVGVYAGNADGGAFQFENFCIDGVPVPFDILNMPPVAGDPVIALREGQVNLNYEFFDADGDEELGSVYRWYEADSEEGPYTPLESYTGREISLNGRLSQKFLKAAVCPVDENRIAGRPALTEAIELPEIAENQADASLLSLQADNGAELEAVFTPEKQEYTVAVPGTASQPVLTALSAEAGAQISLKHNGTEFASGAGGVTAAVPGVSPQDLITVDVTAPDGNAGMTYTVNFNQIGDSDAELGKMDASGISGGITFDPAQPFYQTTASVDETELELTLEAQSASASIQVTANGECLADFASNRFEQSIPLVSGGNIIVVRVKAEDQLTTKLYRIIVNKTGQSNSNAQSIVFNGTGLPGFSPSKQSYSVKLTKDDQIVPIEVTPEEAYGVVAIAVNGVVEEGPSASAALLPGNNTIVISILSPTGRRKAYTIEAFLPSDSNAKLASISMLGLTLSPAFHENMMNYVTETSMKSANLVVQAQEAEAGIKIINAGKTVFEGKGKATQRLSFVNGVNPVVIEVTAADGSGKETYQIDVRCFRTQILSDLNWVSATVGDGNHNGQPVKNQGWDHPVIRLADQYGEPVSYTKGLGVHANSEVVYDIQGKGYTKFLSDIGVDYVKANSEEPHLVFQVLVDDKVAYTSQVMNGKTPFEQVEVDVQGAKKLTLSVTQTNNTWSAHGDWANARFITDDANCNAASILVDGQSLNGFDPEQTEYALQFEPGKTTVPVSVQPMEETFVVNLSVNGNSVEGKEVLAQLETGVNQIQAEIISPYGKVKRYTLNILVQSDTNVNLAAITLLGGQLSPAFDQDITNYIFTAERGTCDIRILAQQADQAIRASYNGRILTGTQEVTGTLELKSGSNLLAVQVSAPDQSHTKQYLIHIQFEDAFSLSDLDWVSATVGDGKHGGQPVKDEGWEYPIIRLTGQNGEAVSYQKGIGTHADSEIVYDITGKGFTKFVTDIGVDYVKHSSNEPHIVFRIYVDDVLKYTSDVMHGSTPLQTVSVDVTGAKKLVLSATQDSNAWSAHANWADARFVAEKSVHPAFQIENWNVDENGVSFTILNRTEAAQSADLILAEYNENGVMTGVKIVPVSLSGGEEKQVVQQANAGAKVLLWSSVGEMRNIIK